MSKIKRLDRSGKNSKEVYSKVIHDDYGKGVFGILDSKLSDDINKEKKQSLESKNLLINLKDEIEKEDNWVSRAADISKTYVTLIENIKKENELSLTSLSDKLNKADELLKEKTKQREEKIIKAAKEAKEANLELDPNFNAGLNEEISALIQPGHYKTGKNPDVIEKVELFPVVIEKNKIKHSLVENDEWANLTKTRILRVDPEHPEHTVPVVNAHMNIVEAEKLPDNTEELLNDHAVSDKLKEIIRTLKDNPFFSIKEDDRQKLTPVKLGEEELNFLAKELNLIENTKMPQQTQFINESNLEFTDISSEQYRIYEFNNGKTIMIVEPLKLNVSKNGGHRVYDNSGMSHYIPQGWLHLSWKSKPGKPNFVK